MKKADRSKYKASSSARAAQLVSNSSSQRPAAAAFGFGGYSGSEQLRVAFLSPTSASPSSQGGELDGTIGQHLRRLAKRDPTTRLKALQALKPLLEQLQPTDVEPALLAWTPIFQRLVMDNTRTVRMEACIILGILASAAGRSLVKALKHLMGPWCLAQADPHSETAKNASAAFRQVFPGIKSKEAVAMYRMQIIDFLEENVKATPESLGDMHKETPEERAERHERVLASSLIAIRNLLDVLLPAASSELRGEAGAEVVAQAKALLLQPGMLKKLICSRSAVPVRSACCALIALLCRRAPDALNSAEVQQIAPQILGFVDEKDAAVHPAMWDMLLSFGRAYPGAWATINVRKVVLPRLMALLRNACYGSAEVSFPAVLPYLALMPRDLLGSDPAVLAQLLSSIWLGWEVAGAQGASRAAAAECYAECFLWTFVHTREFLKGDIMVYTNSILNQAFDNQALKAALGQTFASANAAETVLELTRATGNRGDARWALELLLGHIGQVLGTCLRAQQVQPHKYEKALQLLQCIHGLSSTAGRASGGKDGKCTVFEEAIRPVTEAIMADLGSQPMSAPAAKLLSQVMRWQEGWESKADVSVPRVLGAFLAGPAEGPDAEALADLILAALQHSVASQHSFGSVVAQLTLPDIWDAAREKLPNGHAGNLVHTASMQQTQAERKSQQAQDSVQAAQSHMSSLGVSSESDDEQQPAAGEGEGDSKAAAGPEGDANPLAASPHSSMPPHSAAYEEPSENKQGTSRGCLTHACTLLSRAGVHSEQMRGNEELWRADMLGLAAKHLAQPDVLLSHPHAAKALALLLRGSGAQSFLEPKLLSDVCEDLLPLLEHGLQARASPHIPCSPRCRTAQQRQRAEALALAVVHVLDLSLFSAAVLGLPARLRHPALWLLCAVFRLACLPESSMQGTPEDISGSTGSPRPGARDADLERSELEAAAQDVWEDGFRLADHLGQVSQDFRFQMQESLLHVLQDHMSSLTSDQAQDGAEVEKCVRAARGIRNAVCLEEYDQDGLIDSLMAPCKGWPQYMMPSIARSKDASSSLPGKAVLALESKAGSIGHGRQQEEEDHQEFMTSFVMALGADLGFGLLLQPARGIPRAWLAVELLCHCEERAMQQQAVVLCAYLASRGQQPTEIPSAQKDPLIEVILKRLWDHITKPYMPKAQQQVPLHTLCKLLPDLINGSALVAATAVGFLRSRLGQLEDTEAVLSLLKSLAPALRRSKGEGEAMLSAYSIVQIERALQQPPVMAALVDAKERVVSSLTSLRNVTHCFPVAERAAEPHAATAEERTLLRQLARQQLRAERSARAAMAASERALPGSSEHAGSSRQKQEAEAVLAELQLATVAYCQQDLSQDEWTTIMQRMTQSAAALAVLLEDQAEAVVKSAQQAAAALANQEAAIAPDVALAVLQRLGRLGTSEASAKLEPAVSRICSALEDADRQQAMRAALPWLEILALVAQQQGGHPGGAACPMLGEEPKLKASMSEALRAVWAGGVAAAVALFCGTAGAELGQQLVDHNARFWDAAAAVLQAALAQPAHLTDSIEALDAWSVDTGVNAVSAALALLISSVGHDSMHSIALRLVLSPSILPQIAQPRPDEDFENADDESTGDDSYKVLIDGGVHPLLAARATDTGSAEAFVLAWALLLACMLDASRDHKRQLGLMCGTVDGLTSELLSMLVAVLPLEEAQRASKAKQAQQQSPAQGAAQAAGAAAAARASGSQPAAASLSKEMLRLGMPENDEDWEKLAAAVYRAILQMLPASAMSWFGSLRDRSLAVATEAYTSLRESPGIIAAELAGVSGAGFQGSENSGNAEFRVRANVAAREASAILCIEDNATLEMTVKLPLAWPLRPADVECKRKVGVTEGRLRKWLLSIAAFLRGQNGGLADAMRLWRDNCVREFAGVEECLICYSVIAAQDGQLPRMICSTCSKGFHRACLYKWFRSSHKSVCPHCQSPW